MMRPRPLWPERPRSVYVAFEVFPRPKGASTHIASMVTALARRHGPVWLLCCGTADMPEIQIEDSITIHRFREPHPNMLHRAGAFADWVTRRLKPLDPKPALTVFRDPWGGVPALGALPGVPALFEVNALPSWELSYTYPVFARRSGLRAKLADREWFCLTRSERILTVSEVTRQALEALGAEPSKIGVIPNGAGEVFFEVDGRRPISAELAFLKEGRWFGYFGSLHPWQGIKVLLEAWALLADEWPGVRLLIVSGARGAARRAIRRRIRKLRIDERVMLHPSLSPHLMAEAVSRMELTCAPLTDTPRNTLQGCCPVKIVESMAAGTPVVASDLRVTRALIHHGQDGALVRAGDARAWALALRRLLADDELRGRLSSGAAGSAREKFHLHRIHAELARFFDMTIEQGRAGWGAGSAEAMKDSV